MKIIDDKEVGEMWKQCIAKQNSTSWWKNNSVALIRKLVAERTLRLQESSHITRMVNEKDHAVKSFGINSADWKDDD